MYAVCLIDGIGFDILWVFKVHELHRNAHLVYKRISLNFYRKCWFLAYAETRGKVTPRRRSSRVLPPCRHSSYSPPCRRTRARGRASRASWAGEPCDPRGGDVPRSARTPCPASTAAGTEDAAAAAQRQRP